MIWINIPAKLLTRTVIPERAFEFWSMNWINIPAKLVTWTVIPEWSFEFSSMIWSNIPAKLLTWANVWILIDDLNRMFEFWSIIELNQYSRDNFGLIWLLTCTVIPERTFDPVILWHLFDFVTVGSPRMCFRISFVTVFVLNFPLHFSSEYFRRFCSFRYLAKSWNLNYALPKLWLRTCFRLTFVNWRSSGIWTMRFRSLDFVHVSELTSDVSDLLSRRNLSYALPKLWLRICFRISFGCFRFTFAVEFELIASKALTSYMFPN